MNAPVPLAAFTPEAGLLKLQVRAIRLEAQGIFSFELVDPDGRELPAFEAGAHVDVHLPGGLVRSYSLAGDPNDRSQWVLGVLREPKSKGGSIAMHEQVRVGQVLTVGPVKQAFALANQAKHSILIAGGIGITPLMSMAYQLKSQGASFELHYCARTAQHAAFTQTLQALVPADKLHFHFDNADPSQGLNIKALLTSHTAQTHLYFCGPAGFMTACLEASQHWPEGSVHSEYFKAPDREVSDVPEGGFEILLIRSGERIQVGPDQTMVRAIELTGRRVPTSCLSGLCGTCKVNYLDGEVDHRDYILSDEEKKTCLTVCVSRATSRTLTLDL
jgi:vanillate O-demethylase ferredoxin subunit